MNANIKRIIKNQFDDCIIEFLSFGSIQVPRFFVITKNESIFVKLEDEDNSLENKIGEIYNRIEEIRKGNDKKVMGLLAIHFGLLNSNVIKDEHPFPCMIGVFNPAEETDKCTIVYCKLRLDFRGKPYFSDADEKWVEVKTSDVIVKSMKEAKSEFSSNFSKMNEII